MDRADKPVETPPAASAAKFEQPKDLLRWLGITLAAAGWYVSVRLLLVSLGSGGADPFLRAVCPTAPGEARSDCESVLASPQAYVQILPNLPKLPVSVVGMTYFSAVGLWFLLVGPPTRSARRWHGIPLVLVLGGAAASLYWIQVMHAELRRWCVGCLIVHGLNGLLLVVTLVSYPWSRTGSAAACVPHPSRRLVLAAVAALIGCGAGHIGFLYAMQFGAALVQRSQAYTALVDNPEFVLWDYARQPVLDIPPAEDAAAVGELGAPATVVVFSDFQCPRCRELHELLRAVQREHPGKLRVVHRHYPNDGECNPHAGQGGTHPAACRASRALVAAQQVGGASAAAAMLEVLWAQAAELPDRPPGRQSAAELATFSRWAAELGLDANAFGQALDSEAARQRVAVDIELGHKLGVSEVPTVFLNGRRLRNPHRREVWAGLLSGMETPASHPASADER